MRDTSGSRLLRALLVVCGSLLLTVGVIELSLRALDATGQFARALAVFGQPRPPLDSKSGNGMYYAHHYSAYALKPGYEREGFERINALGFRGADVNPIKPADTYRIVAVGGSTTFGVYLPWRYSYPQQLQDVLRERFGTDRIEVVNAGLTGSTAAETYHRLPTQILPVEPDMVIVYHAFNDLLPRVFNNYEDDYYHFRRSDPNNPPGMTRFYLYRLALRALSPGYFHENYDLSNQVWKTANLPRTDTERAQNFLNSDNHAFRLNLDSVVALLRARNIEVVLASFAMAPDIWHWQEIIPPYMWELGIAANNSVIRELAAQHGVPLVPFAEAPFEQAGRDYGEPMFDDSIHMGIKGNRFKAEIFADTVAPLIAARLGVPVPPPSVYAEAADNNSQLAAQLH
ncbi:MAG: GDSL-type esterase/lipase family protein [Gammaproteobacteria bacterium]|jgi:lysophospholipase L1-like esterase|nr:GDSL-type esterase/lipase family protein [Gammaproteobacteria bacterium]